jgi:hypothetical protein
MNAITPINLAIRQREEKNDRVEREYNDQYAARVDEALLNIENPERLREILDDKDLAKPLAHLMEAFEVCMQERRTLDPLSKFSPGMGMALRAMAEIQRQLCVWEMGE